MCERLREQQFWLECVLRKKWIRCACQSHCALLFRHGKKLTASYYQVAACSAAVVRANSAIIVQVRIEERNNPVALWILKCWHCNDLRSLQWGLIVSAQSKADKIGTAKAKQSKPVQRQNLRYQGACGCYVARLATLGCITVLILFVSETFVSDNFELQRTRYQFLCLSTGRF